MKTAGVVSQPDPDSPEGNTRVVLVSGATGFIGGHLVRRLISRGDRVIVLTRDASGS